MKYLSWLYLFVCFTCISSFSAQIADSFRYPVGDESGSGWLENRGGNQWLAEWDYKGNCGWVFHPGIDLNKDNTLGDGDRYEPVYAIANGEVVESYYEDNSSWGHIILIRHNLSSETVFSLYGHLEERLVSGGNVVKGQQIGTVGKGTNNIWPAHLHFEIRKSSMSSYPARFFPCGQSESFIKDNYYDPELFILSHSESSNHIPFNVGRFLDGPDGWHDDSFSTSSGRSQPFVDTYLRRGGLPDMGIPADNNGGGVAVHRWGDNQGNYVILQDYKDSIYGSDGRCALIYNEDQNQAWLMQGGFWGIYKTSKTSFNSSYLRDFFGPRDFGPPTNEEVGNNQSSVITQDFRKGTLKWISVSDSYKISWKSGQAPSGFRSGEEYLIIPPWKQSDNLPRVSRVLVYNFSSGFGSGVSASLSGEKSTGHSRKIGLYSFAEIIYRFSWEVDNPPPGGVTHLSYSLDGVNFFPIADVSSGQRSFSWQAYSFSPDTKYWIKLVVEDSAGLVVEDKIFGPFTGEEVIIPTPTPGNSPTPPHPTSTPTKFATPTPTPVNLSIRLDGSALCRAWHFQKDPPETAYEFSRFARVYHWLKISNVPATTVEFRWDWYAPDDYDSPVAHNSFFSSSAHGTKVYSVDFNLPAYFNFNRIGLWRLKVSYREQGTATLFPLAEESFGIEPASLLPTATPCPSLQLIPNLSGFNFRNFGNPRPKDFNLSFEMMSSDSEIFIFVYLILADDTGGLREVMVGDPRLCLNPESYLNSWKHFGTASGPNQFRFYSNFYSNSPTACDSLPGFTMSEIANGNVSSGAISWSALSQGGYSGEVFYGSNYRVTEVNFQKHGSGDVWLRNLVINGQPYGAGNFSYQNNPSPTPTSTVTSLSNPTATSTSTPIIEATSEPTWTLTPTLMPSYTKVEEVPTVFSPTPLVGFPPTTTPTSTAAATFTFTPIPTKASDPNNDPPPKQPDLPFIVSWVDVTAKEEGSDIWLINQSYTLLAGARRKLGVYLWFADNEPVLLSINLPSFASGSSEVELSEANNIASFLVDARSDEVGVHTFKASASDSGGHTQEISFYLYILEPTTTPTPSTTPTPTLTSTPTPVPTSVPILVAIPTVTETLTPSTTPTTTITPTPSVTPTFTFRPDNHSPVIDSIMLYADDTSSEKALLGYENELFLLITDDDRDQVDTSAIFSGGLVTDIDISVNKLTFSATTFVYIHFMPRELDRIFVFLKVTDGNGGIDYRGVILEVVSKEIPISKPSPLIWSTPTPTFTPIPTLTPTSIRTPKPQAFIANILANALPDQIEIRWRIDKGYLFQAKDIHIYLGSDYLGHTDGHSEYFIWRGGLPRRFVSELFQAGPVPKKTYQFQVYFLKRGGPGFFGPFTSNSVIAK